MSDFMQKVLKSGLGIFTSRIFGFIRDVVIAGFFGASGLTDAFFVAFAIPNLFRAFFAEGALSSAFVPFLSDNIKSKSSLAANNYLTSLLMSVSVIILVILALTSLFPGFIIKLFMPGYADNPELMNAASDMLVILMPYLLMVTICALLSGFLNLHGSYYVPHSSTAVLNIAMIIGAWIGNMRGVDIYYLCYGVFFGGLAQLLFVSAYAFIKGFRLTLSGGFSRDVGKTFYLVIPSLAGVGVSQVNFMIGRILASFLSVGSISYLYYANRLFQFPLGLFAVAVGTVTLTEISRANTGGDKDKRNLLINKAVNSILIIMLPAMAGLIVLAYPIIDIVFARMNFKGEDVGATAVALQMYSVGLMFYAFLNIFSRVFHSEKDTKTPVKGAVIGLVTNIVFNLLLIKPMGHAGIALASGIAAGANFFYLYHKTRDYRYDIKKNLRLIIKIASATALMSIASYIIYAYGIHILIAISAGIAVYFAALRTLRVNIRGFIG